jgi:hypothetical protein
MVETRTSRRRSRSDVSEASTEPQAPDATIAENDDRVELADSKSSEERHTVNVPKETESKNSEVIEKEILRTKRIDTKRDLTTTTSENELSKLLPGYTAPLELTAPSLEKHRVHGGLEALRKIAMKTDPSTASFTIGTKASRKQTATLLQKTSHGGLPRSYAAAYSSFKTGTKRVITNDAGSNWFNMKPAAMTEDLKKDIALIRSRNYLDPKRFYKSSDPTGKFVQVGTVIEGPTEFFSSRLTKKQRRGNLVDEIMADPASADYAKNKYKRMQQEQTAKSLQRRRGRRGGRK